MTQPHSNQCSHKREFTGSYKWIIGYRVQGSQIQKSKHYLQKSVCISPLCFPVLASFSDSLFLHGRFLQVMSTLALVQSKKKKFLLPCAYSKYPRICCSDWILLNYEKSSIPKSIAIWSRSQKLWGWRAESDCSGLGHGAWVKKISDPSKLYRLNLKEGQSPEKQSWYCYLSKEKWIVDK